MTSKKTASEFIAYRNERSINRYAKEYKVDRKNTETVFVEMLKFLYLCTVISGPCSPPSKEVDNMWHAFLLHTVDYFKFCAEYVGRFLHHDPTEKPNLANRDTMLETARANFGNLDPTLWKHLLVGAEKEACDSNCSGDDYCSEQDSGTGTNSFFLKEVASQLSV